jgi:hypothetical protein
MTQALGGRRIALGLVAGIASLLGMQAAAAAQYACKVPLAVLCPGCATDVRIALQPDGGCRVDFTPSSVGASASAAGSVTLQIQSPQPTYRRGVYARARRLAATAPVARGGCFVFNGRHYCE